LNTPQRLQPAQPANPQSTELAKLKSFLIGSVTREMEANPPSIQDRPRSIQDLLTKVYQQTHLNLPDSLRQQLFRDVQDDLLGYGPIQPLLDDADITEVMVNGPKNVYIERRGKLIKTNVTFVDDAHVMRIIDRIVLPLGRRERSGR